MKKVKVFSEGSCDRVVCGMKIDMCAGLRTYKEWLDFWEDKIEKLYPDSAEAKNILNALYKMRLQIHDIVVSLDKMPNAAFTLHNGAIDEYAIEDTAE